MGSASLEASTAEGGPRNHQGKQWGCASPQLFWIKSFDKGPCRSHLNMTSSNIQTVQRDAESILHPHGNSVPQLLQTDCCLLPTKKILTRPCLNTRLSQERRSEGNIKCWHGIQSRLDGYDCINTEGYPGTFSIAWYTALKRKGMHGRGTVTIWKAKQDLQGTRLKLLSEAEKSESSKQPNATAPSELWGWGSKTVKRVIRCSDSFQFHPVRSQAFITWEENN